MSELQIGVLILGVAVIALVFGFNVFQEWRFRKKTSQAFARPHDDVLLNVPKNNVRDGARHDRMEPVLADSIHVPAGYDDEPFEPEIPEDTSLIMPPPVERPAPVPEPMPLPPREDEDNNQFESADHQALVAALLDPSLDFIAEVVFHEPHELAAMPRFNVGKRTHIIGRTEKGCGSQPKPCPAPATSRSTSACRWWTAAARLPNRNWLASASRFHTLPKNTMLPSAFRNVSKSWWPPASWTASVPM
jgi:hypothetical protein